MSLDLRYLETGKAIRDPIWGYIRVPDAFLPLVDAEEFQRLRDISQLGHVMLVYPGARHSRFEHSLGVFHVAGHFLRQLMQSSQPPDINEEDSAVLLAASLLHDIGHYPFSHLLEEMQMFFVDHEHRSRQIILDPETEVYAALEQMGLDPLRVASVIDYQNPDAEISQENLRLAHILSGTLDPDKIDYLLRDARYCGVPFGESVNRDRLLGSITFDSNSQRPAITYKGVSSVEAMIFTSYLMYRNVYWHHAVRSANAMFKRGVQDLLAAPNGSLEESDFNRATESDLLHRLEEETLRLHRPSRETMLGRLKRRKLYKVARIFFPHERQVQLESVFERLYYNPSRRREMEIELCRIFGEQANMSLEGDEILLDIPRFGKSPEFNLSVFFGTHIPVDKEDPLSFDDPEVSLLKESLLGNFEAQAKVVRIFCIDDNRLRDVLKSGVLEQLSDLAR